MKLVMLIMMPPRKVICLLLATMSFLVVSCVSDEELKENETEYMFAPIMNLFNIPPPLSKEKVENIVRMELEGVHSEPFKFYKSYSENPDLDFTYAEFRQSIKESPPTGGVVIVKVNTNKHRVTGKMIIEKFGPGEYAPPPRGQLSDRMYSLRYPHRSEGGIISFDFFEDDAGDLVREIVVNLSYED